MYLASNDICNVSNQEIELPLNVIRFAKFQADRFGILNDLKRNYFALLKQKIIMMRNVEVANKIARSSFGGAWKKN